MTKNEIAIAILLFLFTSASLGFGVFLFNFDETPMEAASHEMLRGNIGASIALLWTHVILMPSILISVGISKIIPGVDPIKIVPIVGGLLVSSIYFIVLKIYKSKKTK